ncbi:MAG TPA: valine--tRNA ligase [Kiritimatiellia bacterium]|nr:valine--tRNA ligase [Kiritimatiellia bacterium]HNS80440.1 valine--tRNA ligase [Kiritimatiellia bacterium]HPA77339.1 valine--tRNA ligase [Kiritimatiellia bacterium]HQQ04374.1 valine--tRNA ligase [Kiritimatiellia bacterium]
MNQLEKNYDPKHIEEKWYARWLEKKYFHASSDEGGEPYCIVIPPPNVTGILHMGHALNNTIQDVLVRWRRMQGRNALWVPGTDHAGIATQNVVERMLHKEKLTRDHLGREAFIQRVWQWREQYGETIIGQLKKLGASCDWDRERFTMDEGLSSAVAEVFIRLYEKKLIYRGNYIINWCPRCQTALSDEESEHRDQAGKLYHIRYPIKGGKRKKDYVVVATTRPETLLGDVAVAVNPRDERYGSLLEKTLELPILKRELKVIQDDFVDPAFGTGLVKVTPAHDPNDFEMGRRHGLPEINVMNDDGTMNEAAGPYAGMDRFECRKKILADLEEAGLIDKIEDHANAVGHCYRCHTMVEPRLSPQWFVKMKPLAGPALEAVQAGRIRFVPDRWTKVYTEWMENIRDWCISRQIWWGHRIPVFYCDACGHEWAAKGQPNQCPECGDAGIRQDEDVLDTWFSSWLWPFSVFGWPEENEDLKFYYPTASLVTASEIIFFWVARMIMAGMEFMDDIPFTDVYIHGTVRDDTGRKMSKSLGNSIDPLTIIEKYSADALRFSLIMLTATGQDVFLSDDKFEIGRNFGTKIWNAARYMQMQSPELPEGFDNPEFTAGSLSPDDAHILAKLNETISACTESLERFRFNDTAKALYEFFWHQFCDWYVESSKQVLYGEDAGRKQQVLTVMHYAFSSALRLLHPIMPFLTEELWTGMGYNRKHETIMRAPWPQARDDAGLEDWGIDQDTVAYVDAKHDLIRVARVLMADYNLLPKHNVEFIVRPADAKLAERLKADLDSVRSLLRAGKVTVDESSEPPPAMPSGLTRMGMVCMPIRGLIDTAAERARLEDQLAKVSESLQRVTRKLGNMDFISRAPKDVVAKQQDMKKDLIEKSEKLGKLIATLSGE